MKIQLIQPTTGVYQSNSRSGSYPPLGLISIATYIKNKCPFTEVEILDGELLSQEAIIQRIDGDIIGINTNTVTYPQAVEIASTAKAQKRKVVLGGVYASAIPDLILKNRDHLIDHLVVGYGEKPMVDIINGNAPKFIINHEPPFDIVPNLDRSLVDIEQYIKIFQENHPTWKSRASPIFSNLGCTWREKSDGGCIFCSRSGAIKAHKEPLNIWGEVRELVEKYGINYIIDFSDTILQNVEWFAQLIRAKPVDINPPWHVFACMDEIDRITLELLRELQCQHVFIGIESGDIERYRKSFKEGGSPEKALKVAKLLHDYEIEITPSYVIGLPGENEESLQKTLQHAERLQEITQFEEIFCCQLIPFPGSRAFDMLRGKVSLEKDIFDIEELKYLWGTHFCLSDFDTMEEYTYKILDLAKYKITISRLVYPSYSTIYPKESITYKSTEFLNPGFINHNAIL